MGFVLGIFFFFLIFIYTLCTEVHRKNKELGCGVAYTKNPAQTAVVAPGQVLAPAKIHHFGLDSHCSAQLGICTPVRDIPLPHLNGTAGEQTIYWSSFWDI